MSKYLCDAFACAKKSLCNTVCSIISASALSQYVMIVKYIKNSTNIDLDVIFELIALLSVICFLGIWLHEIIKFIACIPKFFKRLLHGKFPFCLTNCDDKNASKSKKSKKSDSENSSLENSSSENSSSENSSSGKSGSKKSGSEKSELEKSELEKSGSEKSNLEKS